MMLWSQTLSQDEMAAQRAREAKELITDLGPAFVKIVQETSKSLRKAAKDEKMKNFERKERKRH